MSTAGSVARVISTLDWDSDLGEATLPEHEVERLRSRLGEGAVRWVTGAAEQTLATLRTQLGDALAPWPVIRTFVQGVLTSTLLGLAGDDALPADTAAIDRDLAEDIVARDIPLSVITRTVRHMQQEWLSLLIAAAIRVGPDVADVIPELATAVTSAMDAWIDAATDAIVEERRRVYLAEQVRVRSAIESLMAAEPVDAEAAGRLLRIPLDGWHLGCAVGTPSGVALERRVVEGIVHRFTRAVGTDRVLRYETSEGTVHVWAAAPRPPRPPRVEDLHVSPPVRVGIGEPHQRAAGFRRTMMEASDALRLAGSMGDKGGISYGEAALAIVLSQDEERARWFLAHELRDLATDSPEMADLRATLRTFYATRMRIAPAAERLFLHRNTLLNRLERIQGVLGHRVSERTAEVQAALVLDLLFAPSHDDQS